MMVRHWREVNCGWARRSVAKGQMVVDQGLQRGEKLLVGDVIGGSLSFSFGLRSRGAVVLPGRRVCQDAPLVAKLGAPRAARVPRALDALQSVLDVRRLELAPKLAPRTGRGVPECDGTCLVVILIGNDRNSRTGGVPENESPRLPALGKCADHSQSPILRVQFVRAMGQPASAGADDVQRLGSCGQ